MQLGKRNNKSSRLSIDKFENPADWLRSFKGCEHYNNDEAIQIISGLDTLASILLKVTTNKLYSIDSQLVVSLHREKETQKIAA